MSDFFYSIGIMLAAIPISYVLSLAASTAYFEAKLKYQRQFIEQMSRD